jgi:hypothetical protein
LVRFKEGDRGVSFQKFRLGIDLDQDVLAGRKRIVHFHIAPAEAKVTDSGSCTGIVLLVQDFRVRGKRNSGFTAAFDGLHGCPLFWGRVGEAMLPRIWRQLGGNGSPCA